MGRRRYSTVASSAPVLQSILHASPPVVSAMQLLAKTTLVALASSLAGIASAQILNSTDGTCE